MIKQTYCKCGLTKGNTKKYCFVCKDLTKEEREEFIQEMKTELPNLDQKAVDELMQDILELENSKPLVKEDNNIVFWLCMAAYVVFAIGLYKFLF